MRQFRSVILSVWCCSLVARADNLLTNGDFSSQNSGFSSDYTPEPSGQSTLAGSYGIRANSLDYNPGYTGFGDHTTGTGYMMLLDGAGSTNLVGWRETVAVQPNQIYYFSAWLSSSDPASPAGGRFAINSQQIGSDFPLGTVGGQWQNFSAAWNSTTNTSAVITLVDTNTVAYGNDFALDDLYFGANTPAAVTAGISTAVEIDWNSQTNAFYQVQYSTALATNTWINLGNSVAGNGSNLSAFDSAHGQRQRFYRIQTLP